MSIPTAEETPAYCQRFTKEEADILSKKETNRALTELGAKLQKEVSEAKNMKRNSNLNTLNEHVQLSELLNEYFDLDETCQKARMLEILTEINKLRKVNKDLSSSVNKIHRKYEEEKDMREEADEQLEICDNEIKEIKNNFEKFYQEHMEILNIKNKEIKYVKKELKNERIKKKLYSYGFFTLLSYTFYISYFLL